MKGWGSARSSSSSRHQRARPFTPRPRQLSQRGRGHALVCPRANPYRHVVRARKRPDVTGRTRHRMDGDFLRCHAGDEKPGGDGELRAGEGSMYTAPDQAVGAIGAQDQPRSIGGPTRLDGHALLVAADVDDPLGNVAGAACDRRAEQGEVEIPTARDGERALRIERTTGKAHRCFAARRVGREARRAGHDKRKIRRSESIGDDLQRTSGQATTARLFPGMAVVEQHDAGASRRKLVCGPRSRGSGRRQSQCRESCGCRTTGCRYARPLVMAR